MLDLAIVGGGPGGLMSAWYLKKKLGELCRITIYEASDRIGGKIVTRKFDSAPAMYEAGVAEELAMGGLVLVGVPVPLAAVGPVGLHLVHGPTLGSHRVVHGREYRLSCGKSPVECGQTHAPGPKGGAG